MRTDIEIRQDVERELQWDPSIDDKRLGIAVHNGVVTLTGDVPNYAERWVAEGIAKRISGVRGVANDIQIQIPASDTRNDTDLAEAAANALQWNVSLTGTSVRPIVKNGWITLDGQVSCGYQKAAAESTVR